MGALRIVEIEIDNFKTFRHETIPLMPGFTAISGPNGSGKSNILDGLLFALGLSSNRTLRAEKGTDLINNGSTKREAKVTVRFGTEDSDERIEVARRIRESLPPGSTVPVANSTYYLNGRVASLTDIHDLLAQHHISPSGYNVVMQGDVTSIIRMTGFERRKIIDEIAGVADFDHRIEQGRKELQTVLEQEERTTLLLGELNARLDALRVERDQALKYRALMEELKRCELAARLAERWELLESIRGLQKVIDASAGSRTEMEAAKAKAQADFAEAQKAEADLVERIRTEGGALLEELETKVREAWEAAERAKLEREAALARAAELTGGAERDLETIERQRTAVTEAIQKAADLAKAKEGHDAEAKQHEAERDRMQAEIDKLFEAQSGLRERMQALQARSKICNEKLNQLQVERMRIEAVRGAAQTRLEKRKEEREAHLIQLRQADAKVRELGEAAERARQIAESAKDDEERSRTNVQNLQNALAGVEAALTKAKQDYAIAEQQMKAQEATMGTAVDAVLDSGIPGVIGTLLQLGEAEPEFARALQEAAGGRLRNIVVEDDHVAAKVSKLLHSRPVGRVTCLPLNKLQPPRRLQQVRIPGCLGYAIDKVKFDSRFEAAFSLAFGDTLIFATLDAARPHIGQYRMVTLEGDVLDKGGAMTVGRSRGEPAQFLANLRAAFEERKSGVQVNAQRVAQHQQALASMQQAAASAAARLRESEQAAHTADLEQQTAHNTSKDAAARLAEDDVAIRADEAEVSRLGNDVEAAIDAGLPVEEEFNELEFELMNLQDEAGDDSLSEMQNAAQKAGWDAGDSAGRSRAAVTELEAVARNKQEAERGLASAQVERERKLADAKIAREEADKLAREGQAHEAALATLKAQQDEAKAGLEEISNAREAARERRHHCENEVAARILDIERLCEGLRHTTEKLEDQRRKLQEMENGLWEDGIELPETKPEMTSAQVEAARQEAAVGLAGLGMVNQLAVEQYEREDTRAAELREKVDALKVEREGIESRITEISGQKKAVFMVAFDQINGFFRDIFAELAGGTAKLSLEDPQDPFNGGLVIHAQPPGSRVYRLEAMSGGEKSLTALAFLFSIQRTQPAPFYALDEVDHALDGVNDERLARMIKRQSEDAQMVVISHRKPMIGNSDQAIGVHARPDGSTRVTGIRWGGGVRAVGE